jgi:hypothetical protein
MSHGHIKMSHGHINIVHGHIKIVHGHVNIVHGHIKIVHGHVKIVHGHVKIVHGHIHTSSGHIIMSPRCEPRRGEILVATGEARGKQTTPILKPQRAEYVVNFSGGATLLMMLCLVALPLRNTRSTT